MKFLLVFGFCVVAASASPFDEYLHHNQLFVDTIEGDSRIANGKTAAPGQFPYIVGLQIRVNWLTSSWCGGSLISRTCVLTAAHCVDNVLSVTLYMGATKRTEAEQTRTVSRSGIHVHPQWNRNTIKNDIALVKFDPVNYSTRVQPIKLASANSPSYVGQKGVVAGWGLMGDSSGGVASTLQWGDVNIVGNGECAAQYGSVVTDCNVCVATPDRVSPCQGDSGGPLVTSSSQVGLVSFGSASGCEKGNPVVFTKVDCFLDFIASYC